MATALSKAAVPTWPKRTAFVAGTLVLAIGLGVLVGWMFDVTVLKNVRAEWVALRANAGLLFALSGLALLLLALNNGRSSDDPLLERRPALIRRRAAEICAGLVALVSLLTLSQFLFGWDLRIDQLLFEQPLDSNSINAPGRMAPAAALNFLIFGCALLLAARQRGFAVFQILTLLGGVIGWLGLGQYVFGGVPLLPLAQLAVHAAIAFLTLTIGVLCLRTESGLMALLISNSAGGLMAKRLVPSALLVPFVLGWLRLKGEHSGWFGTEAGVALFALSTILVFGGLVWASAAQLHASDSQRRLAEQKLKSQLERLNLLHQITRAIGERLDLQSIFQVVIRTLEEDLPLDFVAVCLYDQADRALTVSNVGTRSEVLAREMAMPEQARIPIDENGLSRCVKGQLVYEPDIAQVPLSFARRLVQGGLRSLALAPLQVESQVFGIIVAARRQAYSFSSGECEFLRQLSEHVALAAHQSQLYGALQRAYDDLRQTQQAIMQQERLKALGQMASGIAHDINNAITPVVIHTEMLLEQEPNLSERARGRLATIQRAIEDVARTVSRMGEFYRRREQQLTLTSVNLNELVKQVLDLTRARWSDMPQQRGVMIQAVTSLASDLPNIAGAESEIREALINLIFNAVDAMPDGGIVTLRTGIRHDPSSQASGSRYAYLEVVDTGLGMDDQTRQRCLEPFYTTKGERGTGLGLAMVYGVVQRHSAEIEIETAPGKGTTFRLVFAVPEAVTGTTEAVSVYAIPSRMRILVVDDDPLLLQSLRDLLETDGHLVVTAGGGQAGIDAFRAAQQRNEPFGVVITDLGMPYVDGRKVAIAVKTASPSTPILLLTGWGQRLVAGGDVPQHVDRVLNKPPRVRELREALNSLQSMKSKTAKHSQS